MPMGEKKALEGQIKAGPFWLGFLFCSYGKTSDRKTSRMPNAGRLIFKLLFVLLRGTRIVLTKFVFHPAGTGINSWRNI